MNATGDSEDNPELLTSGTPGLPLSAPVAASVLQNHQPSSYFRDLEGPPQKQGGGAWSPVPAQSRPVYRPSEAAFSPGNHLPPAHGAPAHTPPTHGAPAHTPPAHSAPAHTPPTHGAPAHTPPAQAPPAGIRSGQAAPADTQAGQEQPADAPAGQAPPADTPAGQASADASAAPAAEPGGHDRASQTAPRTGSVLADWSADDPPEDPNRVLMRKHLDAVRVSAANASSWLETSVQYARLLNRDGIVPVTARFSREDIEFLGRAREQVLGFAELGLRLVELHAPLDAGGISTDPSSPILRCRSCMWRWPCPTFRMLAETLSHLPSPGSLPPR